MAILARRTGSRRRMMADINVVPYIDVMLVLVVILMVSAPFVQPSLVDLPSVGAGKRAPDAPITVFVLQNGTLKLRESGGDRTVDQQAMLAAVLERLRDKPDTPVVIFGDKQVPYEAVTSVMSALYKANVKKVGLAVSPLPTPS
jgi:biopolymer transport protein TolR